MSICSIDTRIWGREIIPATNIIRCIVGASILRTFDRFEWTYEIGMACFDRYTVKDCGWQTHTLE